MANIDDDEIRLNRSGQSVIPRTAAAVAFANKLIETHDKVSEDDLQAVRAAGFTDGNVVEIIALRRAVHVDEFREQRLRH
jgi:alkylhydroperoxidase family enzyme